MVSTRVTSDGQPVEGAEISWRGQTRSAVTSSDGSAQIEVDRPVAAVVRAAGYLAEPVLVSPDDDHLEVTLFAERGGQVWSYHAAGDVMFGRRYETPTAGEPLIPVDAAAEGAENVVADVRELFLASDVRTVNVETVLTERELSEAYPKKRFILRSRPATTSALQALQIDVANLANNHLRDFLDPGIVDTLSALSAVPIPYSGASVGVDDPASPAVVERKGHRIGFLSWTTVEGTFVNDSYPSDTSAVPGDLADSEAWQYEFRTWGASGTGWSIAKKPRRVGGVWRELKMLEGAIPDAEFAGAWTSASAVFPELQDWVARRGHGGSAFWDRSTSPARIAALRPNVDVLVVQLHAGFQFQEAASANVRDIAHAAIDAGADMVVCHHPHVLQGLEWYRGKLIAYSLGNFVFDQDFLSTFASVVLRTVWDGNRLLQARLIPVEIDGYRPIPATGTAARNTLLTLWERSRLGAKANRDASGAVRAFADPVDALTSLVTLRWQNHSAVIASGEQEQTSTVSLAEDAVVRISDAVGRSTDRGGLVFSRLDGDVELGRDMFRWGGHEQDLATDAAQSPHWEFGSCPAFERAEWGDAASGHRYLVLGRTSRSRSAVHIRPVARVPLIQHRLWAEMPSGMASVPLDPAPSYSVQLKARQYGGGTLRLRIDLFEFDDSNPSEDPSSAPLGQIERDIEVPIADPSDRTWHEVAFDIDVMSAAGVAANMVMINLLFSPERPAQDAEVHIDDLQFMEWRKARDQPPRFGYFDAIRNRAAEAQDVSLRYLPLAPE
jgi:poly-gamma-glutamate capsule biosynthesis protein CapA/YwtB (metallophosphatase superfamily)